MNILLTALAGSVILAIILWFSIRPTLGENVRRNRMIFMIVAIAGILSGVPLMFISSGDVAHGVEIRSWPEAQGEVIATAITENTQHRPEITVRFIVDGGEHTALCDLGVSGFGSRKYRKNTATQIVTQYGVGSIVSVRYDPQNPSEATLRNGLRWAPLMQLMVGLMFCATGLLFLFSLIIPNKRASI